MIPSWVPDEGLAQAVVVLAIAILIHVLLRTAKRGLDHVLGGSEVRAAIAHPKLATVASLLFSTATFVLWFVAVGVVLMPLLDLRTYFASATVIGLAVGFGSQGLVQDVVIGLTLIFTDAMDVGDTVEVSGQVGRVERMGLRFTTLTNFLGQTVFIPNRNIAVVGRFQRGVIRAYIDVQVPDGVEPEAIADRLLALARGLHSQHPAAVISDPEVMGVGEAGPDAWRYIRLKIRLWPGQQPLVETVFRQRVIAFMKTLDEKYADWMVPVSYRV